MDNRCDKCGRKFGSATTILAFLKTQSPATTSEINEAAGLAGKFTCAYLNVLRDRGQVRQVKRGVWAITKAASR